MLLTLKTNPLGKLNIMPTVIPYYLLPLPCYKLGNGGKADKQKEKNIGNYLIPFLTLKKDSQISTANTKKNCAKRQMHPLL